MVSKSFEGQTDRTEEWYGTQYKQEAITDATIQVKLCVSNKQSVLRFYEAALSDCSCVSEMGGCRPQRQVQITHEKRIHPHQLRDLPSGERLSISPHFNQGKCFKVLSLVINQPLRTCLVQLHSVQDLLSSNMLIL